MDDEIYDNRTNNSIFYEISTLKFGKFEPKFGAKMKFRVYFEDTDAQGIVYHSNYIKFCERARSEALLRARLNLDKSKYMVVANLSAKFVRPAKYGDIVEVRSKTLEIGKASAIFEQKIYRLEDIDGNKFDELLFSAEITIAYLQNGRVTKFEPELIEFFKRF